MSISNSISLSAASTVFNSFTRVMSSTMSTLGAQIILATGLASIVGITAYRWRSSQDLTETPADDNFPQIKQRVQRAYQYVFGGFALTALSAYAGYANGLAEKIITSNSYALPIGLCCSVFASLYAVHAISKEDVKTKHLAWAIFNGTMGLTLSPLCYFNKSLLAQAAVISLGIGGLCTLAAMYAPDDRFLKWEGPLLGVLASLTTASFVALFFPKSSFAYLVDRTSLYGGLVLFSAFMMSSTQRLYAEAKSLADHAFDPIVSSLNIYLDGLNIFIRVLRLLAENKD